MVYVSFFFFLYVYFFQVNYNDKFNVYVRNKKKDLKMGQS